MGFKCPKCRRKLTKGVENRVQELADRPRGFKPSDTIPYIHLLPLQELIASALGVSQAAEQRLYSGPVWDEYNKLIQAFGNEYKVLVDAQEEDLRRTTVDNIADVIIRQRVGGLRIVPGFDGVYGRLITEEKGIESAGRASSKKGCLENFMG